MPAKPLSGRDRAAVHIQCMGRKYIARQRVRGILLITYLRDVDKMTGSPTYQNMKTGKTLVLRPLILTSLQVTLNEVDTGEKWPCAYCETVNKGNATKCTVCKREKTASDQKRTADAEKKAREEGAKKAIEDEQLAQKRMADAKDANEKAALRLPYVPTGAGARATAKGAVLWWTPGVDVGKPLLRHVIKKYRLDDGEWKCRGDVDGPSDQFTCTLDEGLNFGRQFKFEIIAENEDGQSPPSNFTNIIEAGLVLPDGWEKVHDKSGRPYYFHRGENRVSWTVPRPERYQVTPDLRMKFKLGEIDEFKKLFKMYDSDGSGEIDRDELAQLLKRMGERLKASQLDALLRKIDDDGSGDINFQEFCQMVFWMREGKIGVGGKLFRSMGKGIGSMFKKAGKLLSKKKMSEEERIKRKLGNWEMHVNPNIGKPYYFNKKTGETRWRRPDEVLFWLPDVLKEKFTEREIDRFQEDFAAMDLDGGGSLDEEELSSCFTSMNVEISGKKLRKMIAMFDDDGSGEIEFDEFVALVDKLRRGKFGGLGDVFSGAGKKLKKGKKGGKIVPSEMGDNSDNNGVKAEKKARRVFPPLQDWMVDHNLKQYTQTLRLAGFKETKTLLLLKDEDMTTLGFKTGHKRKLTAAIKRLRDGAGKPVSKGDIAKRKRKAAKKFASKYAT